MADLPYGPFRGSASPFTPQQLRARRFRRVHRDVYTLGDAEALGARCDALLVAVPDGVLSHSTAAQCWRLPVPDDPYLHVTRHPSAGVTRHSGVRTHRGALRDGEQVALDGRPVTSLGRTFVDLAGFLDLEQLVAAGDVALRRLGRPQELERAVARARRRRGVPLARAALPLLDPDSRSPGETRCRLLLRGAGFPLVHAVPVHDVAGHWVAEADLGDAQARVAVQYDGRHHLLGDPAQRAADLGRDEQARAAGWQVVVLTARDLRQPHLAIGKVRAAYARAAHLRAA